MAKILEKRLDLAEHFVIAAFNERLNNLSSKLFETLLEKTPYAITTDQLNLYAKKINILTGMDQKRNFDCIMQIFEIRTDLAAGFKINGVSAANVQRPKEEPRKRSFWRFDI